MLRLLRRWRDGGAHRVQVNVRHAGEQSGIAAERLRLKASLPEVAGAPVLLVGLPGDGLVEAFHKPAQLPEPLAVDVDPFVELYLFERIKRLTG
ncbi:hypothetical protein CKO15_12865 [Halorhodospira abdelmalekii]|uniref:hypothetical protein n=1 Tax=Halorhodospira abdelmalekii TaxID=421629 RepID=UPI00190775D5|nr:hypothetical protein [Halorhodospira abdelmalekii]MBK1736146.1 hypothetical protein [Halorhodospira abdelmalekii]